MIDSNKPMHLAILDVAAHAFEMVKISDLIAMPLKTILFIFYYNF